MKKLLEVTANTAQYIMTLAETNELFKSIELVLSIACTLFILFVNIVAWWKKAKKDGKIDKEEIQELTDIVIDGKEKIEDKIKDKKSDR